MRPLARMASWLVVLQLGQATVAWACSCAPSTPEELVARDEPIVVATIVGVIDPSTPSNPSPPVTSLPKPDRPLDASASQSAGCGGSAVSSDRASTARAWAPRLVQLEITEVVSGEAVIGPFEVQSNEDSDECGLELAVGDTWVLQINENDLGPFVSGCSASNPIEGTDDPWLVTLRDAVAAAAR